MMTIEGVPRWIKVVASCLLMYGMVTGSPETLAKLQQSKHRQSKAVEVVAFQSESWQLIILLCSMFFVDRADFGFWILDFGFWILDFGFWILDFGLFFGSSSAPSERSKPKIPLPL
jgi:hypothetical protein